MDACLANDKCSDNAIYEEKAINSYLKTRKFFKDKVEDYHYQKPKFAEALIEEIAEDVCFMQKKKIFSLLDIPRNNFIINRAVLENRGGK